MRFGARARNVDGRASRDGKPRVFYCVLSSAESELLPRTWGVDARRVFFTPYHHTLGTHQLAQTVAADDRVFAGGHSMRNYGPLIEAAACRRT